MVYPNLSKAEDEHSSQGFGTGKCMQMHDSGFWDDQNVPEKLIYEAASWSSTHILGYSLRVTVGNGRKRNKGTEKKEKPQEKLFTFLSSKRLRCSPLLHPISEKKTLTITCPQINLSHVFKFKAQINQSNQ